MVSIIARIGGLPGSAVEPFLGNECRTALSTWNEVSERLSLARAALNQSLFHTVRGAEPRLRRLLLDLKRACYNGRPIRALTQRAEWQTTLALLGPQVGLVLQLEDQLEQADAALRQAHDAESARAVASLWPLLEDPRLMRGMALLSPSLLGELKRQSREPLTQNRKSRRMQRSLIRYVSRAALKTSPYSTFTCIGTAALVDDAPEGELRFSGPPWDERSLVRAKRFLIDQFFIFLARRPPVRQRLSVRLNRTLERLESDRFRLLKPMDQVYDESRQGLRLSLPSQVKLRLSGPIIEALLERSWDAEPLYRELVADLASRFEGPEADAESVAAVIDQLVDVGFLELLPPWTSHEARAEERLADFLLSLPLEGPVQRVAELLSQLVRDEDEFSRTASPQEVLARLESTLGEVWRHLVEINELRLANTSLPTESTSSFYEDVFLVGSGESSRQGEVIQLSRSAATEMLGCGNSILKIFSLFNPRFNFLLSLGALMRSLKPGSDSIGFLELFGAAQPLWREYVASRRRGRDGESFNPYSLPEIEELKALRLAVRRELDHLHALDPNPSPSRFAAIAGSIPLRYDPLVGCCLFLQPVDRKGETWVMNRFFEGTGRYSCRFTAAMPEELRRPFTERFIAASVFETGGRRLELLDLAYGRESTANQHWPQTPKVLEIPGERSGLPGDRVLNLDDLLVHLDPGTALPSIRDRAGVQYLPCQMSAVAVILMPVLLKFLSNFGPLSYQPEIFPLWANRDVDGVRILDRLTFGNVVFRRRRWIFPAALLPDPRLEPLIYFRRLGLCMRKLGIPREVFWIEPLAPLPGEKTRYKPQFLDFSSPLLVSLFQNLRAEEALVTFEEVLPSREDYPLAADGSRRCLEILLEGLRND